MKPCSSCPFSPESPKGLWDPAHYLGIAYLGSTRDFSGEMSSMGCHQFNEVLNPEFTGQPPRCGGWLRAAADSWTLRIQASLGQLSEAEQAELRDGIEVLSPEEMARANGLDLAKIPPLAWSPSPEDARYPTFGAWTRAVVHLRNMLRRRPQLARAFVVPGSPLDLGVAPEVVQAALGTEAAQRYGVES